MTVLRIQCPGTAEFQEDVEEHTQQSVIRGHHVYKDYWSPFSGEHLAVKHKDSNNHDRHAVCLLKGNDTVGHIHHKLSRVFWYFLCQEDNIIICERYSKMAIT